MKVGEFSTSGWKRVPIYKCLRWEKRQIVSDEELAMYQQLMSTFPDMVSEDYETHEEFCAEYSDEVLTEYIPLPDWVTNLQDYRGEKP